MVRQSILIISENGKFTGRYDEEDDRYGQYLDRFSKIEASRQDLELLVLPPTAEALKGRHFDLVLLEADVGDEFYDRYVKTRVSRKDGAVIDLEV